MSLSPALRAFLNGPSSKPPDGVVPNLDNPPNRNGEALAIAIVCILLTTLSTLARLYSRVLVVKRLRIEDYLGFCAFIPFIGVVWCFFYFRHTAGFFVHQWDLRGSILISMGYNSFIIGIVYSLVMLFLKTAILLEWMRIFVLNHTHNTFFWASTVLIALNGAIYISAIGSDIGACRPVEKSWHFWLDGSCIDRKSRDIFNAAFNLAIDIFIFILPQRMVWSLRMSRRRRFGVSIVFSVGLLVVALACGRLYATVTLDYPDDLTKPFDTTYQFSETLLWALCELTCIFLVFCVPAIPKLFAEHGIISRIAASCRSWTRLTPQSWSKDCNNVTRPQTIGSTPNKSRNAARADPLNDEENETQGSLSELNVMRDIYLEQIGSGDGRSLNPDIVRTVEFSQNDDARSKTSTTSLMERQHPWMEP